MNSASVVHQAKEKQVGLLGPAFCGYYGSAETISEQGHFKIEYFDASKFELKILCLMRV